MSFPMISIAAVSFAKAVECEERSHNKPTWAPGAERYLRRPSWWRAPQRVDHCTHAWEDLFPQERSFQICNSPPPLLFYAHELLLFRSTWSCSRKYRAHMISGGGVNEVLYLCLTRNYRALKVAGGVEAQYLCGILTQC
ncbi:hypothetical protein PRIC2_004204 [Phytophthora ramorum]